MVELLLDPQDQPQVVHASHPRFASPTTTAYRKDPCLGVAIRELGL